MFHKATMAEQAAQANGCSPGQPIRHDGPLTGSISDLTGDREYRQGSELCLRERCPTWAFDQTVPCVVLQCALGDDHDELTHFLRELRRRRVSYDGGLRHAAWVLLQVAAWLSGAGDPQAARRRLARCSAGFPLAVVFATTLPLTASGARHCMRSRRGVGLRPTTCYSPACW
jgi:hypothetical protein